MGINDVSGEVVDASMAVHSALGAGLLESVYVVCLKRELSMRGLKVASEQYMTLEYKGLKLGGAYRIDLLVEDQVVVELKAVAELNALHKAQLLTYLKLADKPLGLLINFNTPHLKHGITRLLNPSFSASSFYSAPSALKKKQ